MSTRRATITGIARFVPEKILTNRDFEKMVDTSDEWIRDRTGIVQRHVVEPGTATSDLAVGATRRLLEQRGVGPNDIDLLIVATVTPDMMFPATACLVQDKLGMRNTWGFDLSAACCGFVYALTTGAHFVASGSHERVLVIGADVMSSILDYQDRTTCVLFGDGAGAVLLEPSEDDQLGFLDYHHRIEGSGGQCLYMPAGGSLHPASPDTVAKRMHFVHQDGRQVFKYAVRQTYETGLELLNRHGLTPADVSLLISHQANGRIIDALAERFGLPLDKVVKNIQKYGNTTAATIPLALCDAYDDQKLQKGDLVLFCSVGAGFTVGACLLRWSGLKFETA